MSDNGQQCTGDDFRIFATEYGFTRKTSSPHYPNENGFIEHTVQTVKHLFTKARESGSDPHLAMICLRSMPIDHYTLSPGELLNGRSCKANILVVSTLRDGHVNDSRFHDRRHPRDLPPLRPDESVHVRYPCTKCWEPATVTAVGRDPRAYVVQTADGRHMTVPHRDVTLHVTLFNQGYTITSGFERLQLLARHLSGYGVVPGPHSNQLKI